MEIKIPFYNLLNMFLTGLTFIGVNTFLFADLITDVLASKLLESINTGPEILLSVCFFAVAYEIGLIINRIGSIILETLFKKLKWIPFDDNYIRFNIQKKKYPIMDTLSREYALSRTGVALFLLLTVFSLFSQIRMLSVPLALIAIVYFFSCRKHASKIVEIMEEPIN